MRACVRACVCVDQLLAVLARKTELRYTDTYQTSRAKCIISFVADVNII